MYANQETLITFRMSCKAHDDNWSYWESIPEDENLHQFWEQTHEAVMESRKASKAATFLMTVPLPFAIELMNQHGYMGDVEAQFDGQGLAQAHRRAAITIWKALAKAGVEQRHPKHWWE